MAGVLVMWALQLVSTVACAGGSEELVLGIETSCDDTGVAVVSTSGRVLSDALVSQVPAGTCACGCFLLVAFSSLVDCRLMCMQLLVV